MTVVYYCVIIIKCYPPVRIYVILWHSIDIIVVVLLLVCCWVGRGARQDVIIPPKYPKDEKTKMIGDERVQLLSVVTFPFIVSTFHFTFPSSIVV